MEEYDQIRERVLNMDLLAQGIYEVHVHYYNYSTGKKDKSKKLMAQGITAYLIKPESFDLPGYSIMPQLEKYLPIDVENIYEEYFQSQYSYTRSINKSRTTADGRIEDFRLKQKFVPDHLKAEIDYKKHSEIFFEKYFDSIEEEIKKRLISLVDDYFIWLKKYAKSIGLIPGLKGILSGEQLKHLYPSMSKYISCNEEEFFFAFTGDTELIKPLQWIHQQDKKPGSSNNTSLAAFLDAILFGSEDNPNLPYKIIERCFVNLDNKPFKLTKPNRSQEAYKRYRDIFNSKILQAKKK